MEARSLFAAHGDALKCWRHGEGQCEGAFGEAAVNAVWSLKRQYKAYAHVVEMWWDKKMEDLMAQDDGRVKTQKLLQEGLPIKKLLGDMWEQEFLLAIADMDRMMFEKLFDIARDYIWPEKFHRKWRTSHLISYFLYGYGRINSIENEGRLS